MSNEEEFRNKLKELGLTKVHLYSHRPFPQKYFSDMTVEDKDGQEMARKYFLEAGKMLIKEKAYENGKLKSNWSQERADNSVLGFNDDQQLIVFPWNTPTYTMTALWLGSKSEQWYPLFSRINKAQKSSYEAKEKNK